MADFYEEMLLLQIRAAEELDRKEGLSQPGVITRNLREQLREYRDGTLSRSVKDIFISGPGG